MVYIITMWSSSSMNYSISVWALLHFIIISCISLCCMALFLQHAWHPYHATCWHTLHHTSFLFLVCTHVIYAWHRQGIQSSFCAYMSIECFKYAPSYLVTWTGWSQYLVVSALYCRPPDVTTTATIYGAAPDATSAACSSLVRSSWSCLPSGTRITLCGLRCANQSKVHHWNATS